MQANAKQVNAGWATRFHQPDSVVRLVFGLGFRHNSAMNSLAKVLIHQSQFPEKVRRDLHASLRNRQVNHKFHYDSVNQMQKWLAVHRAYAPSRADDDCITTYETSYADVAARLVRAKIHLVALGCGSGQKEQRLLDHLRRGHCELFYTPLDVSTSMVLVARNAVIGMITEENCFATVLDLAAAPDLSSVTSKNEPNDATRLVTCFGLIPNFQPNQLLPLLPPLLRRNDFLLCSANLSPGPDYPPWYRENPAFL
jgi:uncharacterized SAM-dependent methyltransferase